MLFDKAIFEIEKLRVVCCACCFQYGVTLVAKKHVYTPTVTVEVRCRIRSFCCSLSCFGSFFSERQIKLTDRLGSAYSSYNTEAWLVTIRDILLLCESLTRLFNRISVDKTVGNCIHMRDIIVIFTVRNPFVCVCVFLCVCVRERERERGREREREIHGQKHL